MHPHAPLPLFAHDSRHRVACPDMPYAPACTVAPHFLALSSRHRVARPRKISRDRMVSPPPNTHSTIQTSSRMRGGGARACRPKGAALAVAGSLTLPLDLPLGRCPPRHGPSTAPGWPRRGTLRMRMMRCDAIRARRWRGAAPSSSPGTRGTAPSWPLGARLSSGGPGRRGK